MDARLHLGILLRELERRGPETTGHARCCIEAVLSDDGEATRRAAIEAIEALPRQALSLFSLGTTALLELGPEAAPALKRWILAHGKDAHSLVWATLHSGVDAAPGLAAFGELLEDPDEALAAAAAAGVGASGQAGARYVPRLRELSRSLGDSWLRGQAMAALGQVGAADRESLDILIRGVREGDEDESLHAMMALGRIGPAASEAVDAVCAHLKDEAIFNACEAAIALRRIGVRSRPIGDALARALDGEENPDRYLEFLRALGELGVPSPLAGAAIDAALRSPDEAKRAGAMVATYLARGDTADLHAALSRWDKCDDVLWLLSEWRVPLDPFADDLLRLLRERADGGSGSGPAPEDAAPHLVAILPRLGARATAAIPALERIAMDEREAPWTRDAASEVLEKLRAPGA